MRALARELEVTPGALYRYVSGRDELLTALIIDAYRALGAAVEAAVAARDGPAAVTAAVLAERWRTIHHATRAWAIAHPHEYALLYGTPVPGYVAPPETVEPATTVVRLLANVAIELEVLRAGETHVPRPPLHPVGPGLRADLDGIHAWLRAAQRGRGEVLGAVPDEGVIVVLEAWTGLFGAVSFELFGHYAGSVEHAHDFLDLVTRRTFAALGRALGVDPGEAPPHHA